MSKFLFSEFEETSPSAWKQKIQVDLKGADYNDTLLYTTNEGITVKPFYTKEDRTNLKVAATQKGSYNICQTILIVDDKEANNLAIDALKRGANSIQFIAHKKFDYKTVLNQINFNESIVYFKINFLDADFIIEIDKFINHKNCFFQIDIFGNLAEAGNWYISLKEDAQKIKDIIASVDNSISISGDLYENAGANIVQQLAYMLAHATEYIHIFGDKIASKLHFEISVGTNYFHEIAKLRAFKLLWKSLLTQFKLEEKEAHIFAKPTLRNKTIYDYNVNMLRTTSECMSAILGGATTISNVSYDEIFAVKNEFGERISRNQLLILKEESGFENANDFANGSYYIDSLTEQMAEKALAIFKQIEKGGGFLKQLKEGVIQRKLKESASKEETQFLNNELILLGTNLQPNKDNLMHDKLVLDPFLKQRNIKTLFPPINRKRLSEKLEKQRLKEEKAGE
ncbi:methylmalonyl-CoA mutase [Polaribacter sp. BM10]|uniref:methylmalonyl-CoA mutase subunit beta n=1 Tax=Polaribacter sp. BM10 TaxID=1529069 RepID=UPI000989FFDD|nr:methylmalonyl-CoA mutase subunit beta [Polaribacter sp. BM10]AQS95144.1 methylmalonyl-CoA mutase [Polaribacter sp. BM10]